MGRLIKRVQYPLILVGIFSQNGRHGGQVLKLELFNRVVKIQDATPMFFSKIWTKGTVIGRRQNTYFLILERAFYKEARLNCASTMSQGTSTFSFFD